MEVTIALQARLQSAFNLRPEVYIPQASKGLPYNPDYSKAELPSEDNALKYEVQYSDAVILPGALLQGQPFDEIKVKTEPVSSSVPVIEYAFPYDPLVDVNYVKKVNETEVFGGASVVEMAGTKEADIRIRGVLWNDQGLYPSDQLEELLAVFQEDSALEVVASKLFLYHSISSIYIKSISLPALEGFRDTQPFVIEAREIVPVELEIFEA